MSKPYKSPRFWLWLQTLALLIGTFIGWREIIREVNFYCEQNAVGLSGLTDFTGGITTNPVLTPCFWGSLAFAAALIWSVVILFKKSDSFVKTHVKRLFWLLAGASIFAWANTSYTFYKYFSQNSGTDHFGCPANRIDNPFTTACFMGAVAFTAALIANIVYRRIKRSTANSKEE